MFFAQIREVPEYLGSFDEGIVLAKVQKIGKWSEIPDLMTFPGVFV